MRVARFVVHVWFVIYNSCATTPEATLTIDQGPISHEVSFEFLILLKQQWGRQPKQPYENYSLVIKTNYKIKRV